MKNFFNYMVPEIIEQHTNSLKAKNNSSIRIVLECPKILSRNEKFQPSKSSLAAYKF
jgi:hypothetical protein